MSAEDDDDYVASLNEARSAAYREDVEVSQFVVAALSQRVAQASSDGRLRLADDSESVKKALDGDVHWSRLGGARL